MDLSTQSAEAERFLMALMKDEGGFEQEAG
jgi:hypothetical protein